MRTVFFCILAVVAWASACAEGTFTRHDSEVEDGYNFILYEPDSMDTPKPLIIMLHSRSASGHNLDAVDMFGTIDALHSGMELDAVVMAPQATGYSWDAHKIMKDVEWLLANKNIDRDRIYAVGMSMGGDGVAALANAFPERIAAAIILAGALDTDNVSNLNKVPLWVIRGLNDREGAIARTDRMVDRMRALPDKAPRLVYNKIKGLDHRQHERMLYMPCFYDWLMGHSLQNLNRPVNTTFEVTPKLLKDAYKGLHLREGSAAQRKSARPAHTHRMPRRMLRQR